MEYVSVKDIAIKWGISERRVQELCSESRVPEAIKVANCWLIPVHVPKPEDKRSKSWIKYQGYPSGSRMKDVIYGELPVKYRNSNCTVYEKKNGSGYGVVRQYKIYPGIDVFYKDIYMDRPIKGIREPLASIMEINHCKLGRFEAEFEKGNTVCLSEGDLGVTLLSHCSKGQPCFPLSRYYGISFALDLPIASLSLKKVSDSLGLKEIDLDRIKVNTDIDRDIFVLKAAREIENIFSELYRAPEEIIEDLLKVKLLELLLFLSTAKISSRHNRPQILDRKHIELVKRIRSYLIDHLSEHITLSELSEKFEIPLSSMKSYFKAYYGTPVSTYIREFKMQRAAQILENSERSVADIAESLGYENPAKFTHAFQKIMKTTPSRYRSSLVHSD